MMARFDSSDEDESAMAPLPANRPRDEPRLDDRDTPGHFRRIWTRCARPAGSGLATIALAPA